MAAPAVNSLLNRSFGPIITDPFHLCGLSRVLGFECLVADVHSGSDYAKIFGYSFTNCSDADWCVKP